MTGRRLYDHYADSLIKANGWYGTDRLSENFSTVPATGVSAWPMLSKTDRKLWNELARRITPKPRKVKQDDSSTL